MDDDDDDDKSTKIWVENLRERDQEKNEPTDDTGTDGYSQLQGGSNMTGTDLCVNKPHCAAAVRP